MKHIIIFTVIVCFFLVYEYQNHLINAFSSYSYLIRYISTFAVIMTIILRTRQIMSLIVSIKAKIIGTKKIQNQICKNDEIDRIQNIVIANLEERVKKIELWIK